MGDGARNSKGALKAPLEFFCLLVLGFLELTGRMGYEDRNCLGCGDVIRRWVRNDGMVLHKYCGRGCGKGKKRVLNPVESRTCFFCKKILETENASSYCSTTCRKQKKKERAKLHLSANKLKNQTKRANQKSKPIPLGNEFYLTDEWRQLRYKVLKNYNGQCMLCGRSRKEGVILHVDHIKPRSIYPALELEFSNLQILCADCNIGKLHLDETDWRSNDYYS